jgi:SprB repeat/Dockerin type I domain
MNFPTTKFNPMTYFYKFNKLLPYYKVFFTVYLAIFAINTAFSQCPTITSPSSDQTICAGAAGANITVATDNNVANGIKFVKFTYDPIADNSAPTADELAQIYDASATILGTPVTPVSGIATYTFTASDFPANGEYYVYAILCPDQGATCRPFQEIKITVNSIPMIVPFSDILICAGATNTTVYVPAYNGLYPYTYELCPSAGSCVSQSNNDFAAVGIGNYTMKVTDANNCSSATMPLVVKTVAAPLGISVITKADPFCNGESTGFVTLYPSGGVDRYYTFALCAGAGCTNFSDYKYANTEGDAVQYTGLTAGTYQVQIIDAIGCEHIETIVLTEPTAVTATITPTNASNCTTADGKIDISNVSGGTPPYTYTINSNAATVNNTGLLANTYTVCVRDNNGCKLTKMVNISSPNSPTAFSVTSDKTSICVGQTATLTLSGSQIGVNYQLCLNGANVGAAKAGTGAPLTCPITGQGTYSIKATASNGCVTTMLGSPSLLVNPYPLAPMAEATGITCIGDSYYINHSYNEQYPIEFLYNFTGNSLSPTITGTGKDLAFGYNVGVNATGAFAGSALTSSGYNTSTPNPNKFIEFTVSPFAGVQLILTNMSFDVSNDGNGPINYEVRSSLDNYGSVVPSSGLITNAITTENPLVYGVAPPSGITYRIYPYGATTSAGLLTIDNITITGVASLPGGTYELYSDAALTTNVGTGYILNDATTPSTATAGVKCVYLAYRSEAGCLSPASKVTITVKPKPNGKLTGSTICEGETGKLTFTATSGTAPFGIVISSSSSGGNYYSNITSGVPFDPNPTPNITNTYTIDFIQDADGCLVLTDIPVANATITVNPIPNGNLIGSTICTGGDGQLTFSGDGGAGPYELIINGKTYTNIKKDVPFNVTPAPTVTTTYSMTSLKDMTIGCTRTMDFTGYKADIDIAPCKLKITDPCACRNNATTPTNGQFTETLQVEAAAGQTWYIKTVSGLYKSTSTATNLMPFVTGAAGEQLVDLGAIGAGGLHIYQLKGAHVDAVGYDITVANGLGGELSLPRTICYYPRINVGGLPITDCKGGGNGAFTFNASAPNSTISYILDGVALASPSVSGFSVGNHTLTIIADAGAPTANDPNDPGCTIRQNVHFSIANPNLTPDCKGTMTLSLGNCQDKIYPQQVLNTYNVDVNELTLVLRDKSGKILPNNFITTAQVGQTVSATLTYSCNGKTCETLISVQDNNAPTAYSPNDGFITCSQYRELLAKGEFTPKKLSELFGAFSPNDNCVANLEIIEGISTDSVRLNDCVNRGFILRTFSAQEKYGYRRIAKTTQKITFINDQNFRVKFPPNKDVKCTEPIAKLSPTVEGVGCENVQMKFRDEVFVSPSIGEAKQCYKIIRHWTVINMCRFNPTRNNYLPEGDADINYDYSFVKDTIIANYFSDPRGTALNDNILSKIDATATTGFSPLLTAGAATLSEKLTFHPNIIAGTRTVGFVVDGRIKEDVIYIRDYSGDGVIRYTQILNIVDDEAPTFANCPKAMQTIEGSNFTNDCRATITLQTSATDNCSAIDKITYSYIIKPFNTNLENDWIKGNANRFSGVLPVTNSSNKSHTMIWQATDACGNVRECSFPFRVLDAKKPNMTAQNISASLTENNTLELGVRRFVLMGTDNCTPMSRLRFSFSENVTDTIRLFTCKDYPSSVVKIYVTDEANNQGTAEASIRFSETLNSANCNATAFSTVSGAIFNSQGVPLSATTSIILDNQPSVDDDVVGSKFSFKLRNGGNYIVQPRRNNDLLNGVTTYDLVQIQQHILDINVLDNPYKIIAADVNKDGKITTLDVLELRKAILRLTYQFANNTSWRFIQKTYKFQDVNNPIIEDLPAYYKLTNLRVNTPKLDFIGVKIGDVNETAQGNFSNDPIVEVRNRPDALHFLAEDRLVQPQEIVTIQVKSEGQLDLNGFQTTLHFDESAMIFEGITANALPISQNNIGIFKGLMTMSWNTGNTMRFAKDEGLFTLTFRAKKAILLSDALFSSSQYTASEIYTLKNNDISVISPLEIVFSKTNETALTDALYQNIPNPFEGETTLSFRLAKAQKVTISITDAVGKVLQVIQQDAFAGYNELKINNLPIKGVLFYHLMTPTFKASKKMVNE